jgi:hypothetical protein
MKALRGPFEPDPGHAGEGTGHILVPTSLFLARLIGPIALIAGAAMLVNRKDLDASDMRADPPRRAQRR